MCSSFCLNVISFLLSFFFPSGLFSSTYLCSSSHWFCSSFWPFSHLCASFHLLSASCYPPSLFSPSFNVCFSLLVLFFLLCTHLILPYIITPFCFFRNTFFFHLLHLSFLLLFLSSVLPSSFFSLQLSCLKSHNSNMMFFDLIKRICLYIST